MLTMRETGAFATEHQRDRDIYSFKMRRQSHFLVGKGLMKGTVTLVTEHQRDRDF